jgi:hypothetical protein
VVTNNQLSTKTHQPSSHHHLTGGLAPITRAGGTHRIDFYRVSHTRREAIKGGAGARGLRGLHRGRIARGRQPPVVDGRTVERLRFGIQLSIAKRSEACLARGKINYFQNNFWTDVSKYFRGGGFGRKLMTESSAK